MMKKTVLAMTAALMLSLTAAPAVFAEENAPVVSEDSIKITASSESEVLYGTSGWIKDSKGWWYSFGNGSYAKSGIYSIGGKDYFFNQSGYMVTGWVQMNNDWLYFTSSGAMCTPGWQKIGGKWYHFSSYTDSYFGPRVAVTRETMRPHKNPDDGRLRIGGKYYYFNSNGSLYTGWLNVSGPDWRYYTENGEVSGWMKIGSKWYYFDPTTHLMWSDILYEINGVKYAFDENGAMVTGWLKAYSGDWYYFDSTGAMASGWKQINGKWYYFHPSLGNAMSHDGMDMINGKLYAFGSNGAMITGWYLAQNGCYFYLGANGAPVTGWKYFPASGANFEAGWRYFDANNDGIMLVDKWWIGDYIYCFDQDGRMRTGWVYNDPDLWYCTWSYYDEDGRGHNGWLLDGTDFYYCIDGDINTETYLYIPEDGRYACFDEYGIFQYYL